MEYIIGKELGPYRVLEKLGEGGMATVYLAYQASVDRDIALKVLPRQLANDAKFIGRFEQEARLVARLQHPHILPAYDYGESDGYTYIAMPYVSGGTLADRLTGIPWPLNRVNKLTQQMAGALDYAHNQGLVHRDIKPSNILIDDSDNSLLSDFGIAKLYESTAQFTRTGGILGTPAYMSPEQGLGESLDRRSDIYSLGVVLYELVTGRVPFSAETPVATVFKHINDPLPPPHEFNESLPQGVERIIYKALAKAPGDRFQTAGELAATLEQVVRDPHAETMETMVDSAPRVPVVKDERKLPSWLLPAAAVLLLLLLAGAALAVTGVIGGGEDAEETAQAAELAALVQTATAAALVQPTEVIPEPTEIPPTENPPTIEPTEPPTIAPTEPPPEPTIPPTPDIHARVELTGSGQVQMTLDNEDTFNPGLSDDQRYLYASTQIGGFWRVVRYDTTTGERLVLTQQTADFWHPRPTKDGRTALVSSDPEGQHEVYLLDLESGALIERLTDASGDDTYARWLPDESGFVFQSFRDGDPDIYVKYLGGSPAQKLTNNEDWDVFPDISPDGSRIAYQSNIDGDYEIYTMGVDGVGLKQLTSDPARDAVPVYSPDGQWIVFESDRGGNYDIWAMRTDGGGLFNVTSTSGSDQVPEFSPDGRWLLFQSSRDGDWDIYRVPWPHGPSAPASNAAWPVSTTGVEACHLSLGDTVTAGDNTRFWSEPDVLAGSGIQSIDSGTSLTVLPPAPVWGPIRRDIDASGWWWELSLPDGGSGWVWQGRLWECEEG